MAIITDHVEATLDERGGDTPGLTTRIRSRSARAVLQRLKIFSDFPGFSGKSLTY